MLRKLNSKLRGWAFSNRQVVAKRLFSALDNELYYGLCRWLRHRNKTKAWIKHRYSSRIEGRQNIGTFVLNQQGKRQWLGVFRMADVPIRRHVKIRGGANPYDPANREYFKDRAERQVESPRGTFPPGAHRTRRERLRSSGSIVQPRHTAIASEQTEGCFRTMRFNHCAARLR